jgi:hypothetical protein
MALLTLGCAGETAGTATAEDVRGGAVRQLDPGYLELRGMVLGLEPDDIGLEAEGGEQLLAVLMESGIDGDVATLVGTADGAVSLYYSNGGGQVGLGRRPSVARAGERYLAAAREGVRRAPPVDEPPLPLDDRIRLTFVTAGGLRSAECSTQLLLYGDHPLQAVFLAANDLLTAIFESSD